MELKNQLKFVISYKIYTLGKKAGIKVRMVTGDNLITARAIANDCEILDEENNLVMEGPDFYKKIGGVVCANC